MSQEAPHNDEWCPCDAPCSLVADGGQSCSGAHARDIEESACGQHASYPPAIRSKIDFTSPLLGEFKKHTRHILIAAGSDASKWPEDVTSVRNSYAAALDAAVSNAPKELGWMRISTADAPSLDDHGQPVHGEVENVDDPEYALDLLVFPDQIRVPRVRKSQLSAFVAALAQHSKANAGASSNVPFPLPHVPLPGTSFLICAHKLRDKRRGITGPILVDEIDKTIATSYPSSSTPHPIHTFKISHIGGHKFAGNVIVYGPKRASRGVWYGRVMPCHVPHLLLAHCPDFVLIDTSEGERKEVRADDQRIEAELARLKPLLRGQIESAKA